MNNGDGSGSDISWNDSKDEVYECQNNMNWEMWDLVGENRVRRMKPKLQDRLRYLIEYFKVDFGQMLNIWKSDNEKFSFSESW